MAKVLREKAVPKAVNSVTFDGTSYNKDWATEKGVDAFLAQVKDNPNLAPGIKDAAQREEYFRGAFKAVTGLSPASPVPAAAPAAASPGGAAGATGAAQGVTK